MYGTAAEVEDGLEVEFEFPLAEGDLRALFHLDAAGRLAQEFGAKKHIPARPLPLTLYIAASACFIKVSASRPSRDTC